MENPQKGRNLNVYSNKHISQKKILWKTKSRINKCMRFSESRNSERNVQL